jgi:endonuclease/exonuclease/phosphatase family metal-dependent hydrolase
MGFSVLSLNLRFGLAKDGENDWAYRKALFPELMQRYGADFMAFQEVNDFQATFLDELLTGHGFIGKREPAPAFWQNNLIFYTRDWRCLDHRHFFLSHTPHIPSRFRQSRWPRQCTLGAFARGERRLRVASTHFDFDPRVQAQSARVLLDQLADFYPDTPVLVMGDFNAPPQGACFEAFVQHGFHLAFEHRFPATHHGFTGRTDGDHIDWLLYQGPIRPTSSQVIQKPVQGKWPSDHFPVRAAFEWE